MKRKNRQILLTVVGVILVGTSILASDLSLVSHKRRIAVLVNAPNGWNGPTYKAWPSYETWSFSKEIGSNACYFEVRIDSARPGELDWNAATSEQVRRTFADFANPVIEKVADVAMNKSTVTVWAAHNVDGEILIAKLRYAGCDVNFSLPADDASQLRRYRKLFISTLKTVRIRDATLPPRSGIQ